MQKRANSGWKSNSTRNYEKKEFKQADTDYINKTIQDGLDNNNSEPFWRYIKAKRQDNIGVAPLKRKGNLYSESKDKAQILVEQFYSVFTKLGTRTLAK